MKRLLPIALSFVGMTFATPALAADGAALFTAKACAACHHVENDQSAMGLGPSVKMIGAAYDGKKEDLVKFLNADPSAKPIVKPDLYPVMQGQQQITKAMSDEERSALADYMLSKK
jgi:cytochrome c551/c552